MIILLVCLVLSGWLVVVLLAVLGYAIVAGHIPDCTLDRFFTLPLIGIGDLQSALGRKLFCRMLRRRTDKAIADRELRLEWAAT